MTTDRNPTTPTERTLPPLLTAQERVARLCHDCGALGKVYAHDGRTVLCVEHWLARYEEARAC